MASLRRPVGHSMTTKQGLKNSTYNALTGGRILLKRSEKSSKVWPTGRIVAVFACGERSRYFSTLVADDKSKFFATLDAVEERRWTTTQCSDWWEDLVEKERENFQSLADRSNRRRLCTRGKRSRYFLTLDADNKSKFFATLDADEERRWTSPTSSWVGGLSRALRGGRHAEIRLSHGNLFDRGRTSRIRRR
jgi:hypothetical protein